MHTLSRRNCKKAADIKVQLGAISNEVPNCCKSNNLIALSGGSEAAQGRSAIHDVFCRLPDQLVCCGAVVVDIPR